MIVIKDDKIIINRAKVIPSTQVLEGIVKYIISFYNNLMLKRTSIVTIHPLTNKSVSDEFQIKTNKRLKFSLLQIAKGGTHNHINFSKYITNGQGYGQNFRIYKIPNIAKYKAIVDHLYSDLKVNELMKLRLSIDEVKESKLHSF